MQQKIRISIVVIMSFFSFIGNLFSQEITSPKEVKKAERVVKKLIRKKKIPGIAITITKSDTIVWQKGYGYANLKLKTAIDPKETIFRIASVSKPLSATVLAKLVEEGRIDLDASLYTYLSSYPKKKYDFTIKQLGGHLAGIRTYKGREFFNKKRLTIAEGVALFKDDALLFEPGTSYAYNSYDWVLLSLVMQEVLQQPFESIVKEKVLDPLELHHTFPDLNQEDLSNKATFYSKRGKRRFRLAAKVDNYFKLAGGGYLSTSDDVAKLGNAYLKEGFIQSEIAKEFVTAQKVNENSTYYGIGWEASFDTQGRAYYGHTGNGIGGYAIFRVYPKEQVVFSILMNVTNPGIEEEINAIVNSVFDSIKS